MLKTRAVQGVNKHYDTTPQKALRNVLPLQSYCVSALLFLAHRVFPTGLVNVTIFSTSESCYSPSVGIRQCVAFGKSAWSVHVCVKRTPVHKTTTSQADISCYLGSTTVRERYDIPMACLGNSSWT